MRYHYTMNCALCGESFSSFTRRKNCFICRPQQRRRIPSTFYRSELLKASQDMGERNDCTVTAFANAGKLSYQDAHSLMELAGRKPRDGGYISKGAEIFNQLGLGTATRVKLVGSSGHGTLFSFEELHYDWGVSLGKLLKRLPLGSYVVRKRGHAFAIVDGKVHDYRSNGSKTRITEVWKIERLA